MEPTYSAVVRSACVPQLLLFLSLGIDRLSSIHDLVHVGLHTRGLEWPVGGVEVSTCTILYVGITTG